MEIRITYICDGAIYCGVKPEGVEILEERQILYPEHNYILVRKTDGKKYNSVWLKDGDTQDNYIEVERKDDKSSM